MSGRRSTKKGSGNRWAKANATLNATKKVPVDQQPPNHPQENSLAHRTFLARSLRRNDEDMAALVDLNRSLEKVKCNLIEFCGEDVLLDLGEGVFQLTPCERDLMVTPTIPGPSDSFHDRANAEHQQRILQDKLGTIDDASKLLCVDFLLRMKLRRRLLNRLARRLMRVAHAMDGEDVTPPPAPKYGDLRLHLDPKDMEAAKRQWELQEEARQRVAEFRRTHPNSWLPLIKDEDDDEEEVVAEEEKTEATVEPVKSEENAAVIVSAEEAKNATKENQDTVMEDSDKTTDKKEHGDVEIKDTPKASSESPKEETAEPTKTEDAEKPVVAEEPKSAQVDEKEMDGEKSASEGATATKVDEKEKAISKETAKEGEEKLPSTPSSSPSKVSSDAAEALLSILSSPAKSPTTNMAEAKEDSDKIATAPVLPGFGPGKDTTEEDKDAVDPSSAATTTDDKAVATKEEEPKEDGKAVDKMETEKSSFNDKPEEDATKDGSDVSPAEDTGDKMDVEAEAKSTEKETSIKTDDNSKTPEAAGSDIKSAGEKKEEDPTSTSTKKDAKTAEVADAGITMPEGAASTPVKEKAETETPKSSPTKDAKEPPSSAVKLLIEVPPPRELSQLEKDYEILKDFVDAYEKNVDPVTGEVSFRALAEEDGREEDYAAINRGVGIGAVSQKMSLKEKEMEFQRWQSAVLGRIPEAPTLDEIGMKNCVFRLEERRKRVRLQKEEEERETKRRRREERGDDASSSDDEEEAKPVKRNIGAVERKSPSKKNKEEEDEAMGVTKLKKPLPLVPYPSFYESDLRRIRQVHFDLMSHSIRASAQQRVQAVTAEYNAGTFRKVQFCMPTVLCNYVQFSFFAPNFVLQHFVRLLVTLSASTNWITSSDSLPYTIVMKLAKSSKNGLSRLPTRKGAGCIKRPNMMRIDLRNLCQQIGTRYQQEHALQRQLFKSIGRELFRMLLAHALRISSTRLKLSRAVLSGMSLSRLLGCPHNQHLKLTLSTKTPARQWLSMPSVTSELSSRSFSRSK